MAEELMTTKNAAAELLVAEKTLKDWLRAGKFPGVKVGGRWRVRRSDVDAAKIGGPREAERPDAG